ncbi:MAG TPA: hypothetical protein VLG91_05550 [Streptomyces sp.]|nr:hypothetical protein [Streptomyces sp.]
MFKKTMQATAALALATSAITGAAATAQASEQPVQQTDDRGSVGVQSLIWKGPYDSHSSCLTIQNEYRRYYTITIACKYFASTGYYFEYDNGR